ncbi:fimbrial protein [Enterobacter cancerogenus]|uniref:fimbrial protein n=1 Tax=Enterobacter cancerogenus TaxID=69218 RepID=UPI00380D9C0C
MKKVILASLMPILIIAPVSSYAVDPVAPQAISVSGGKINFTGSVVAAPCAVDNSFDGQSVTLGQITTNQLASKGASGSAVPFNIKLIGCNLSPQAGAADGTSNYTKASITFSGATVDATTLQVTADGTGQDQAKNVGIQIMQANKPVNVDGSTSTAMHDLIMGTNEIPFTATYVATDASVTAGVANGTVDFKVNYE